MSSILVKRKYNWQKVCRNSLYNTLHRPYVYVFAGIFVVVTLILFIVLPHVITIQVDEDQIEHAFKDHPEDRPSWFNPGTYHIPYDMLVYMSSTVFLPLAIFYASMMAENNANNDERTYILARPVSRNDYMTGKLLSSFINSLWLFALIALIMIAGFKTQPAVEKTIPEQMVTQPYAHIDFIGVVKIIGSLFICMLMGTILGTCYKYYLKEKLVSVILLMISIIIYITVQQVMTAKGNQPGQVYDMFVMTIPLCIFLPLTFVGCVGGYIATNKVNVMI